jgi:hypothetical protein
MPPRKGGKNWNAEDAEKLRVLFENFRLNKSPSADPNNLKPLIMKAVQDALALFHRHKTRTFNVHFKACASAFRLAQTKKDQRRQFGTFSFLVVISNSIFKCLIFSLSFSSSFLPLLRC